MQAKAVSLFAQTRSQSGLGHLRGGGCAAKGGIARAGGLRKMRPGACRKRGHRCGPVGGMSKERRARSGGRYSTKRLMGGCSGPKAPRPCTREGWGLVQVGGGRPSRCRLFISEADRVTRPRVACHDGPQTAPRPGRLRVRPEDLKAHAGACSRPMLGAAPLARTWASCRPAPE